MSTQNFIRPTPFHQFISSSSLHQYWTEVLQSWSNSLYVLVKNDIINFLMKSNYRWMYYRIKFIFQQMAVDETEYLFAWLPFNVHQINLNKLISVLCIHGCADSVGGPSYPTNKKNDYRYIFHPETCPRKANEKKVSPFSYLDQPKLQFVGPMKNVHKKNGLWMKMYHWPFKRNWYVCSKIF